MNSESPGDRFGATGIKKKSNYFLKYPCSIWYERALELPPVVQDEDPDENTIKEKLSYARKLYKVLSERYKKVNNSRTSGKWYNTVLTSGTLSDKVMASYTIIGEFPLYSLNTLQDTLGYLDRNSHRQLFMALDSIKKIFMLLLPDKRCLVPFYKQPLNAIQIKDYHLVYWIFEDGIAAIYKNFLSHLEKLVGDKIPEAKIKAIKIMHELAQSKPEQRVRLIKMLTEMLNDKETSVASYATRMLKSLSIADPQIKHQVLEEVETFLHKSYITPRARHYCLVVFNSMPISGDVDVQKRLISIYFNMFHLLIDLKKEIESTTVNCILNGLSRCFSYLKSSGNEFESYFKSLFKIAHVSSFGRSIQALNLIYHVQNAQSHLSDNFYKCLYEKLFLHEKPKSSNLATFFNLIFKTLKVDKDATRILSFVKRLLQVSLYQDCRFMGGSLYLVSELFRLKPFLRNVLDKAHEVDSDTRDKAKMVLDSIMANDDNIDKNILQSGISFEGKKRLTVHDKTSVEKGEASNLSPAEPVDVVKVKLEEYNGKDPDPRNTNANKSLLYELTLLIGHYHPTISTWAKFVRDRKYIELKFDPIEELTEIKFMDSFVTKNPKGTEHFCDVDSSSLGTQSERMKFLKEQDVSIDGIFEGHNVPVEELFFYKYFFQKNILTPKNVKSKKKSLDDELDDSSASEQVAVDIDSSEDGSSASERAKMGIGRSGDESEEEREVTTSGKDGENDGTTSDAEEDYMDSILSKFSVPGEENESASGRAKGGKRMQIDNVYKKMSKKQGVSTKSDSSFKSLDEFRQMLDTSGNYYSDVMSEGQRLWESERYSDVPRTRPKNPRRVKTPRDIKAIQKMRQAVKLASQNTAKQKRHIVHKDRSGKKAKHYESF